MSSKLTLLLIRREDGGASRWDDLSVSMLSFKTKQRPWKVVLAIVSIVSAVARGAMVVEEVPRRGVREIEEGMKEVEPLILRKED